MRISRTLNYLVINEKPNLSNTTQILTKSFGTTLIASVLNPGAATKINPEVLVQRALEEKERNEKALTQMKKQKDHEVAKLNGLKEKMSSRRRSGDTVTLRNLFGGSR